MLKIIQKINQVNKQSRISIIKFAGDKSDKVRNDTYTENRYKYNYTQIMDDFFTATNENKEQLKDVVNSISPAGATYVQIMQWN